MYVFGTLRVTRLSFPISSSLSMLSTLVFVKEMRTMNEMKIKKEETKKKYDHLLTTTDRLENSTTNR